MNKNNERGQSTNHNATSFTQGNDRDSGRFLNLIPDEVGATDIEANPTHTIDNTTSRPLNHNMTNSISSNTLLSRADNRVISWEKYIQEENQLEVAPQQTQDSSQRSNQQIQLTSLAHLVASSDPEFWKAMSQNFTRVSTNNKYARAYDLIMEHHVLLRTKVVEIICESKKKYHDIYKSLEMDRAALMQLQRSIDNQIILSNDSNVANSDAGLNYQKLTDLLKSQTLKTRNLEVELEKMKAVKFQYDTMFQEFHQAFLKHFPDSSFFTETDILTLQTLVIEATNTALSTLNFIESLDSQKTEQPENCRQLLERAQHLSLSNYSKTTDLSDANTSKITTHALTNDSDNQISFADFPEECLSQQKNKAGFTKSVFKKMHFNKFVPNWNPHDHGIKIPPLHIKNTVFPLNRLPNEILTIVLQKIDSKSKQLLLMQVCKSWALIICSILYYRPPMTNASALEKLTQVMHSSNNGQTVFNYNLFIKRLNFSFVTPYLKNGDLLKFVNCPNLERLTLVFCKNIDSNVVAQVLKGCKILQSVDLTGARTIEDSVFTTLAEECPRLQGFYAPNSKNVSFNSLSTFISSSPHLKRLKITGNSLLNDELLKLLAKTCPLLVEVDITESENVTDAGLIELFARLNLLREFRITHNKNVTDNFSATILAKTDKLHNLRLLEISSCENISDKTVENFVYLAPKLRQALFGKCGRLTDAALLQFSKLGKNLQTLHMGHCIHITDKGVTNLIKHCPRLQYLDFACCVELTNKSLVAFGTLTKLKRIGLVKCSLINDDGMLKMIEQRGKQDSLERVHLSYCTNLTIYPIYRLLDACPKLSHLSLTAIPSFLRSDITTFCRLPPNDFTDAQRQIFCVFSGGNVKKLREHLTKLINTNTFLTSNLESIITSFIESRNLRRAEESPAQAEARVIAYIDRLTPALLSATQSSPFANLSFPIDLDIRGFRFDQTLHLLSSLEGTVADSSTPLSSYPNFSIIVNQIEEHPEADVTVAPGGSFQLNRQLRDIVEVFAKLRRTVLEFKVNVISFSRVKYQFAGCLIALMCHLYIMITNVNTQIEVLHQSISNHSTSMSNDLRVLSSWKASWKIPFQSLLHEFYKVSLVLRLVVNENLAELTRSREKTLRTYHLTSLNRQIQERLREYTEQQKVFSRYIAQYGFNGDDLQEEIRNLRALEVTISQLLDQQAEVAGSFRLAETGIGLDDRISRTSVPSTLTETGRDASAPRTVRFTQMESLGDASDQPSNGDPILAQRERNIAAFERLVQNRRMTLGIMDEGPDFEHMGHIPPLNSPFASDIQPTPPILNLNGIAANAFQGGFGNSDEDEDDEDVNMED
ncbi:hypothetical protein ACO0QE_004173 [Hanseniaspora vineae]